jgi:hypothetical protein
VSKRSTVSTRSASARLALARWLTLACLTACAPRLPAQYVSHARAAQEATARGEHDEAAAQWAKAAEVSDTATDRDEALYRQATSTRRAGNQTEYERLLGTLAQRSGSRQERAAYDLALMRLTEAPERGASAVRDVILRYPSSGLARGALDRWLATLNEERQLDTLTQLERLVTDPSLHEYVLLLLARRSAASGDATRALVTYQRLEHEHPYPHGHFWDEAMLEQATVLAVQGDQANAAQVLRRMLSFRERSAIVGSYERRYSDASLLLAYLSLSQDWRRAHELLSAFDEHHPNSRHTDDALWAAALLARDNGASALACHDAERLREVSPQSRYVRCLHHVCSEIQATTECRNYVVEKRNTAASTLRASAPKLLAPIP